MKNYDVIVIGAGHNGLLTACYLAKAGFSVLVAEQADHIGGATSTYEMQPEKAPGFMHEFGALSPSFIQASPLMVNDELGLLSKYGYETVVPSGDSHISGVFEDDTVVQLCFDLDKTYKSIAEHSTHDADAYVAFFEKCKPFLDLITNGSFNPPPSIGGFFSMMDSSSEGQFVLRTMMKSAYDLLDPLFENEKIRTTLMKVATEMISGPDEAGTALSLMMMIPFGHRYHWVLGKGGNKALPESMERCLIDNGGEVILNSRVKKIKVSGGEATGIILESGEEISAKKAVIGNLDPRNVFPHMVSDVDDEVLAETAAIRDNNFSLFSTHIALNEHPKFKAGSHVDDTLIVEFLTNEESLRRGFDDLRYGDLAKEDKMAPLFLTSSAFDPTRAPEGKHTLYICQPAPYKLKGGAKEWDNIRESYSDEIIDFCSRYVTNLDSDNIIARTILSPLDLERQNPTLVHGGIVGPGNMLYQNFSYRPFPKIGKYETTIKNLFLTGLATHPGGGVNGGGRAAAQVILEKLGVDFESVIQ